MVMKNVVSTSGSTYYLELALYQSLRSCINAENLQKSRRRTDRLIERHNSQINNMKRKQDFIISAMFVMFSLMIKMVFQWDGHEVLAEDGGYDSLND